MTSSRTPADEVGVGRGVHPAREAVEGERAQLTAQALAAAGVEAPVGVEERAVPLDLGPELGDALALERADADDRRLPVAGRRQGERVLELGHQLVGARAIGLGDGEDVGDLHQARLDRLHPVAAAGHQRQHDRLGERLHLDLVLARADGLHQHHVEARRVEHQHRVGGGLGEAAQVAAAGHRADEHARVEEVVGQPDPIAQHRAAREGAGGVDADDAHALAVGAQVAHQGADQRALAHARGAGDADPPGAARSRDAAWRPARGRRGRGAPPG